MPVSPVGRLSFEALFEPDGMEDGDKKFSCTLLIPKKMDAGNKAKFAEMYSAADKAAREKFGFGLNEQKGGRPVLKSPFRDGSEKPDLDGYTPEIVFVKFSAHKAPIVVDQAMNLVSKESGKIYNGSFGHVSWTCYAYEKKGNKGVAFGLNNYQKVADGDPFGIGRTNPEDDFSVIQGFEGSSTPASASDLDDLLS